VAVARELTLIMVQVVAAEAQVAQALLAQSALEVLVATPIYKEQQPRVTL